MGADSSFELEGVGPCRLASYLGECSILLGAEYAWFHLDASALLRHGCVAVLFISV